jgi:hypothetical protein
VIKTFANSDPKFGVKIFFSVQFEIEPFTLYP